MRHPLPRPRGRTLLRVVGIGNPWRGDDGAGLAAAGHLRGTLPHGVELLEREGEPTGLIDAFDGAEALWLLDAVSSGAPAGTLHRLEAGERGLPAALFRVSSHHLGLADAIELARAVGRLPARVVVYGIEGAQFGVGDSLTPEVEAAAAQAADAVRAEVRACRGFG